MTIRHISAFELPTVPCAKTIPFVERFSPPFRSAVTGFHETKFHVGGKLRERHTGCLTPQYFLIWVRMLRSITESMHKT